MNLEISVWSRSCSCYQYATCIQCNLILRAWDWAAFQGHAQDKEVGDEGRAGWAVRKPATKHRNQQTLTAPVNQSSVSPALEEARERFPRLIGLVWRVGEHFQNTRFLKVGNAREMFHFRGIKPRAQPGMIDRRPPFPPTLLEGLTTQRRCGATTPTGETQGSWDLPGNLGLKTQGQRQNCNNNQPCKPQQRST